MESAQRSQNTQQPARGYVSARFSAQAGCPFTRLVRIDLARKHPHIPELNVLVVGMPNVGKSTLLNALRSVGIPGRAFPLTSAVCRY